MSERYRTVLLFGPPGSGKGTQGKLLGDVPGFFHLATGDMFRAVSRESELGRRIRAYSSRGELVPDELTVELWRDHVKRLIDSDQYRPDADLLLLDGIPRSPVQAEALRDHTEILGVICLHCPNIDELVSRMMNRALEEGRRDDADEKIIRHRFEVYDETTAPVLALYDDALVHLVAADDTPEAVHQDILKTVVPLRKKHFGSD